MWSIDLVDMIDYKTSTNRGYRYIFIKLDNISKFLWCVLLESKIALTITNEF